MIRRPPRSTQSRSSAASDVYKRQEVCPVGSFGDSNGVCHVCPSNCANCSVANICTMCSDGYYLLTTNASCVGECPPGFATKISTHTCHQCLPNCAECSVPNTCLKCADTFSYYEPNRSCLSKCPDGFYTDSRSFCSACKAPCSTCSGSCLLYTSPSPRDATLSRMPSSA